MRKVLLAAALAIGLPTLCLAGQPLSDAEAQRIIDTYWSKALFNIPIGTFDVVEDGADGGPRAMPRSALERWYLPLEQAGVLAIMEDPPEMLAIPQGRQTIDAIASNEPVQGSDDYRIVRVLYTMDWDDAVAKVQSLCDQPVTPKQKSIVLLKFDAASNEWKVFAEDDANAADDFCTQKVARALQ